MVDTVGWVKLHRKINDWEWRDDPNTFALFMHCILMANRKPTKYHGHEIPTGGFVTGRKALSVRSGLSEQQVRTALKKLEESGVVTIDSTNKFSIISIDNWKKYQEDNQQATNKQPTSNQQVTTEEEDNNIINKEDNKVIRHAYDLYNQSAEKIGLPIAQVLSDTRKKHLKARLEDCGGIDGWKTALEKLEASSFCRGEKADWKANLDFILQQSSFIKLMEGVYDDHKNPNRKKTSDEELQEFMDRRSSQTSG